METETETEKTTGTIEENKELLSTSEIIREAAELGLRNAKLENEYWKLRLEMIKKEKELHDKAYEAVGDNLNSILDTFKRFTGPAVEFR